MREQVIDFLMHDRWYVGDMTEMAEDMDVDVKKLRPAMQALKNEGIVEQHRCFGLTPEARWEILEERKEHA